MSTRIYNVLFVCTGNAARSILAECLMREIGSGTMRAFSAGSFPTGEVHPFALRLLEEQGLATAGLHSKSWNEFATPGAPLLDFVFTVCDQAADEICPAWPGRPVTARWSIPDPAAAGGSEANRMLAFRDAFRMLERRVKLFLALPFASLSRISLQDQVDLIGRLRPYTTENRAS